MNKKILRNLPLRKVSTLLLVALYIIAMNSVAQKRSLPADTTIVKTGKVVVKGKEIPYKVTTGTQPVYEEDGEADALFSIRIMTVLM